MNERMEAIGRKVGLVVIGDGVFGQRWYSSKCGLDVTEYEQLVTEIVKECASIFPETDGDVNGTYRDQIYDHFGVEE